MVSNKKANLESCSPIAVAHLALCAAGGHLQRTDKNTRWQIPRNKLPVSDIGTN